MAFQWTTNYLHTAPSGAASPSITGNNTAWANSNWVEIHPGTDCEWVLTGVIVGPDRGPTTPSNDFELDVGVVPTSGAISGCVAISTFKGQHRGTAGPGHGDMRAPIPVDKIPAGHRVGMRVRKGGSGTATWGAAIEFYKKPISGNVTTTTQPLKCLPSAADPVSLPAVTVDWGWSNWVQLTSGANADWVLAAVGVETVLAQPFEVQIGVGPSGGESPLLTLKGDGVQVLTFPGYNVLENPREGISSGDRVAARWRHAGTSATQNLVAIHYYEEPL